MPSPDQGRHPVTITDDSSAPATARDPRDTITMTVVGGLTGYERAQLARGEKPVPAHRAAVRTTERAGGTPVKITTIGCDLCSELVPQDETWSVSGIDVCPSCQQRPIADLIPLIEAKRQAQRDKSAANRARYYAAARPRAQGA